MGLMSKLFGPRGNPEWATFFSPEDYAAFEDTLRPELAKRSLPSRARDVRAGGIPVRVDGEEARLGFDSLARKCRGVERERWGALVAEHLDRALESTRSVVAGLAASYEAARASLKVQLVPQGMARDGWVEGLNYRTFGAGVLAALVHDLPTCVLTVEPETVRRWGDAGADRFEVAAHNVRALRPAPTLERVESDGFVLQQLTGDDFFVCSHALWLDQYPEAASDRGMLLSVPNRHSVLFHPIRDSSAWQALSYLPYFTDNLYSKLPGPVSNRLFWLRGGTVTDIPVTTSAENYQVAPPPALIEALGPPEPDA